MNFLEVFESTGEVCDADAALVNVRRPLSELVVAGEGHASSLLCSHGDDVPSTSISLSDAFPSPKVGVRKGHKQVHAIEGDLVVVAHECASLRGRHVVDGASSLVLDETRRPTRRRCPRRGSPCSSPRVETTSGPPVAPRALACLEACSTFQMGDETRRAPPPPLRVVGHEGGDWARIGVELFPHGNNVDATELYTCHGGGAQGAALVRERLGTPEHAEGHVVVVEAALADEVRRLLPDAKENSHGSGTVGGYGRRLGRGARPRRRLRTAKRRTSCGAAGRRRPCCGAGRGPWCSRSAARATTRPWRASWHWATGPWPTWRPDERDPRGGRARGG